MNEYMVEVSFPSGICRREVGASPWPMEVPEYTPVFPRAVPVANLPVARDIEKDA